MLLETFGKHVNWCSDCLPPADSVFQIAAHEVVVAVPKKLYEYCPRARFFRVACDVARVIVVAFEGESGPYRRTSRRHDFSRGQQVQLCDRLKRTALMFFPLARFIASLLTVA